VLAALSVASVEKCVVVLGSMMGPRKDAVAQFVKVNALQGCLGCWLRCGTVKVATERGRGRGCNGGVHCVDAGLEGH